MTTDSTPYDVVVVGGGIQGAGIALAAQKVGYSVLLVEKNTWASATSSKSSKLIHGGLRYLQTGQIKLVYECLQERQWMLDAVPDLVKPNWFYLPVYRNSHYPAWKLYCGLWLYRLLAGRSPYATFKTIPQSQWSQLAGLKQEQLKTVFAYQDAQTDDAQLTQRAVETLINNGGQAWEYTELIQGKVGAEGYQLQLQKRQQFCPVSAKIVVNAAGPWVNDVLDRLTESAPNLPIDLVQGSHLVVAPQLSNECFYLQAPQDNRAVFCLPWKQSTLVGTTELIHQGAPETATVTPQEIDYLTAVVKHYFPDYTFTVTEQFCGLRVLPQSTEKAFSRPRDTLLETHGNIISVYGGKLTGWRATAIKTLKLIDKLLQKESRFDFDKLLQD